MISVQKFLRYLTWTVVSFIIVFMLYFLAYGNVSIDFNFYKIFHMRGRLDLKCCKCEGMDKISENNTKSNWNSIICPRHRRQSNIILNLTCPTSFEDTEMSSVAGCNVENELINVFNESILITETPQTLLLLSPTNGGIWVKCCCSRGFCKFQHSLQKSVKNQHKKNSVNRFHHHYPDPRIRPPRPPPRPRRFSLLFLISDLAKFGILFVISFIEALSIIEILFALMIDPTNVWNDVREPLDAGEALWGVVQFIIQLFKIQGASF